MAKARKAWRKPEPKNQEQANAWFYEHELCRLRASERAGFKVDKERAGIEKALLALKGACAG